MYHYNDYDSLSEATAAFDRLRALETNGKVRWVNMSERGPYLTLFSNEKPYVVSWHEWVD